MSRRGVAGLGVSCMGVPRVPCAVRSNASWVMVTWGTPSLPPVDRQTDRTENITFPQMSQNGAGA